MRGGTPAHGLLDHAHLGVPIGVVLAEVHSGAHVQDIAQGGSPVAAALELRHLVCDEVRGGQHTTPDEVADDAAHDGLGDRHEQVRGVGARLPGVTLKHYPPTVDHDDGVGVGVVEHLVRDRLGAIDTAYGDLAQRLGGGDQWRHRSGTPGDALGGYEFTHVRERPPVVRRLLPVRERDPGLCRRRESLHEHRSSLVVLP